MFDMNQCKPKDKLISIHGAIFIYKGTDERHASYRHIVEYPNGSIGTRTDDGRTYINKPFPEDHDIVGFYIE